MLKPWAKNSASPSCRCGSMDSLNTLDWCWSGTRIMMTSASLAASATVRTFRPSASAFGQADAYVDAGVAQGERVGVALGAVANDSYFAVLQQGEVGIFVIVFLGHESVVLLGGICGWFIWSERGRSWICRRGQLRSCR